MTLVEFALWFVIIGGVLSLVIFAIERPLWVRGFRMSAYSPQRGDCDACEADDVIDVCGGIVRAGLTLTVSAMRSEFRVGQRCLEIESIVGSACFRRDYVSEVVLVSWLGLKGLLVLSRSSGTGSVVFFPSDRDRAVRALETGASSREVAPEVPRLGTWLLASVKTGKPDFALCGLLWQPPRGDGSFCGSPRLVGLGARSSGVVDAAHRYSLVVLAEIPHPGWS
ncbi:MAG: hypothetical protein GY788_14725 [bacterium]|nr:hypothetical protein [bacterium]